MDKQKLTDKQRRFVEFYCGECKFNATQAAIKAGYSENTARNTGYENMTKPDILKGIQEFMNQVTNEALVTTEWIVGRLKLESERDDEGSSHSARIGALGKLSDYTGGFDKNKNHTVHSGTVGMRDVTQMSDEDLEREMNND